MMRDSPAELARALPGPYESTSKTRLSRRAKCDAVHAPNTPAPTMTTSNRSIAPNPYQKPAQILSHPSRRRTIRSASLRNRREFSEHSHPYVQTHFLSHHDAVKLRVANFKPTQHTLRRPHA